MCPSHDSPKGACFVSFLLLFFILAASEKSLANKAGWSLLAGAAAHVCLAVAAALGCILLFAVMLI